MSNQLNVSVLVAARNEYSNQLKRHLQPLIQEGFTSIFEDSVIEDEYSPLKQFQIFLKQVPNWNQSILNQETTRIKNKCPYLMDMVTAIFVSHVKILASVRLGGKHSNIKIKIPTAEIFIHSVYVAGAESFYYDPEVFDDYTDRQNMEIIKSTIDTNIDDTISAMIPIQSILQEYLCNTFTDHIKPVEPEPIPDEFDNVGDVLSGNDIMSEINDNEIKPTGYESDKSDLSDLSELFTPNNESESSNSDTIFPIGDTAPFEDKINDNDFKFGELNLDDTKLEDINTDVKDIPVSDNLDFLGLDDNNGDDNNGDNNNGDNLLNEDFTENIPVNQDNFGFNEPSDNALESDFNFFDNNDIL